MRIDSIQQFMRLRSQLTAERDSLKARLGQINEALGEMPLPSLSSIQGATGQSASGAPRARRGRRTMSPQARARIAAAQRARWAKQRGGTMAASANGGARKKKRRMSAEGRKAIAEAARKRWAAAKAAGKTRL